MNDEELRNVDLSEVSLLLKTLASKFVEKEICKDGNMINTLYKDNRSMTEFILYLVLAIFI